MMWTDDKGTRWGTRNEWIRLGKRDGKAGRAVQYPMNPAYLVGYQTGVRYANEVREMA